MRQPSSFPRWFRKSSGRPAKKRSFFAEKLEERRLLTADPIVTVDTNYGNFQIELFPDAAPQTVANFLSYVESGAYTNSIFHRTVPNFVVQTGGYTSPSETFTSTSQFQTIPTKAPIPLEYNLPNKLGSVAMARTTVLNSATDQWFINTVDNSNTLGPGNGGGYAVFGQVLGNGMQVINAISALPVDQADNGVFASLPLGTSNHLVRISSISVQFGIEGTVFTDFNSNGSLDPGETGSAGRTVFIDNDGTGVPDANNPSTTTDANGHYAFGGLAAGTYTIGEVAPANVVIKQPSQSVTLSSNRSVSGVDFAEEPSISGTVFVDLNGNGRQDAGEAGLAGQIVYASGDGIAYPGGQFPSTTTDANGHYSFSGLAPGSYTVYEALPPSVSLSTSSHDVIVTAGATLSGVDFGELPSITGTVFNDANQNGRLDAGEQGIAGRTVFVHPSGPGASPAFAESAATDANGRYWFLGLAPGAYAVAEDLPPGVELTTPQQTLTVTAGQSNFGVDFGETRVTAPNERFLYAIYRDILARAPDADGLAFWTKQLNAGLAPSVVAAALAHSDEYYANFVIKPAYRDFLAREVDPAGLAYWTAQLHAGISDQQFESDVLGSDEFFRHAGGAEDKWVDPVYQDLLKRAPDNAGLNYWLGQLNGGMSRETAALTLAKSNEVETATIADDYQHYLGRAADADGVAYWLKQFAESMQNEDLIAGFAGSAEYYKNHTA